MKKGIIILAALTLLLASCGTKNIAVNTDSIIGRWTIENAMGVSTKDGMKEAYITFDKDGKVNGNASVNSFFGGYTLENDALKFGNMGMTRMMGPHMEIEDAVTRSLNETRSIKIKGSKAVCHDKDGKEIMTLKKK